MKLIREKIAEDYDELNELSAIPEIKKYFPKVIELSTPLKTVPRGYDKDHPAADWLKKKDYGYYGEIEQSEIFSAELKETLLHRAKIMVPFLEYFRTAVE